MKDIFIQGDLFSLLEENEQNATEVVNSDEQEIMCEEIPTRIALSEPKCNPSKGLVHTCTLKEYDELISSPWLKELIDDIRAGDESKKAWLPFRLAHYAVCKDNHRAQADIQRSSFNEQTVVDVDDDEYVEIAKMKALELDKQEGLWNGHLLHMEYSARKKLHIDIRIPKGMTIEEAQIEYCRLLDIPFDKSCTTPERFIYLTTKEDEIYRSPDWYKVPDEELDENIPNCDGQDAMFKEIKERPHAATPLSSNEVQEVLTPSTEESADEIEYNNLPIKEIVKMYWELHNNGKTPMYGDRNTKIFELACALRHILNFDRELLNQAIPNYDGFPQVEKMQCIDNALREPRKYMPTKLKQVIQAVTEEHTDNPEPMQPMEEVEQETSLEYVKRLPKKIGLGIDAALKWLPKNLHIQALIAIAPALGALLTHVRLLINGEMDALNLQSFIVGEAGSGKRKFAHIIDALMKLFYEESNANLEINNKNRKERERKRNAKDVPVFDMLPERVIPARHSVAQVLDMLKAAGLLHCYTFTQEADVMSGNGRQAFADTSTLRRAAFDGSDYSQSYKSDSASRVVIKQVHWNITQCGTPDALLRAYPNHTDGALSRVAIAIMPDNTFAPHVVGRVFGEKESLPLEELGKLLSLMQGTVELPKLEEHARKRTEEFRLACLKDYDRTAARTRMRIPAIVMRMICAFTACSYAAHLVEKIDKAKTKPAWTNGAQTAEEYLKANPDAMAKYMKRVQNKGMMEMYDVLNEYLTDTMLYYFRTRIDNSYNSENYLPSGRKKKGKNDLLFDKLPTEFSLKEAAAVKGKATADKQVRGMVFQWTQRGLLERIAKSRYRKKPEYC